MAFIFLHIPSLSFLCQVGENEGDYWQWEEFSSSLQWTYRGPTSALHLTERLFFFTLKHACSIPQGPFWCLRLWRNADEREQFSPSTKALHPYVYNMMSLTCFSFYASMETLIQQAASYNLSILESLKRVYAIYSPMMIWHLFSRSVQFPYKTFN